MLSTYVFGDSLMLRCTQIGKEQIKGYSQSAGREVAAKELVSYVVKYMMDKGMSLDNTEGMIDAAVFPVNYFTLKQVSTQVSMAGLQSIATYTLRGSICTHTDICRCCSVALDSFS